MKNKHLSLEDRIIIEEALNEGKSFKKIAELVDKDCSAIPKEIKRNFTIVYPSSWNNSKNICKNKQICTYTHLCDLNCNNKCNFCKKCNSVCKDFEPDTCEKLDEPPYVCNGCKSRNGCRKIKYIYKSKEADNMYRMLLKESRTGINLTNEEFSNISNIVVPAIKNGHSPAMIVMNNPDLNRSEASLYRDISNGIFNNINNSDLPRKVKMKKRVSNTDKPIKNTKNRENRTYEDYLAYKAQHPTAKIVQLDTVEGIKGGKCLFTLHFPSISFMIAFLIESQKSDIIVSKFDILKKIWGENFCRDFEICLTDNGKEFQLPDKMEFVSDTKKVNLFYCDPGKSYQKAEIENNHTFIRRILPKGTSFDNLTQNDINLMMSHINSVPREELNGNTPFEVASLLIGKDIIEQISSPINKNEVLLKPKLLKKD